MKSTTEVDAGTREQILTGTQNILAAEALIEKYQVAGGDEPTLNEVRAAVTEALVALSGVEAGPTMDLAGTIDAMLNLPKLDRDALLFTARLLDVHSLLPEDANSGIYFQRRFTSAFELILPDISKLLGLANSKQAVDKIQALRGLHGRALQTLEAIAQVPATTSGFLASKQLIFQTLNNQLLKAYFHPYGYTEKAAFIRETLNSVAELLECKDATFILKMEACEQKLADAWENARGNRDLFSVNAFAPFYESAKAVLADIRSQSVDRFRCSIGPIRPVPKVIERRFPLHDANRIFRATLPLVNDGPGLALDTVVTVVADSGALFVQNERLAVGTVEPGEFAVTLDLLVGDPATSVVLLVEVQWSTAHSTVREDISFEAHLVAQNPDVPWDELEAADPYSIEVAHGDEFVGRRAKVTALAGRLRRPRMQSSYITGQKRVGKTSLALAVQNHVEDEVGQGEYEFIYLEYGEYARSDAAKTVTALGLSIAKELSQHLYDQPAGIHDFDASIAPLNQIAQQLIRAHPEKRFIIILDEFDEIHPEMYRFGPLAEAFFSNLRTLSAKQNISLMLVGGENMPFIIGAQGDQLNKFVPEQLSYFSRTTEWEDFVDIVKLKNASSLTWYESSLTEIFRIANGHPYYTKMLCARIYLNAVAGRDTEITVEEVGRAMRMLIDGLDTNAFAHFWKDGIAAERSEAEVAELKRKRVLVAVGQTKRQGVPLTLDAIVANVRMLSMSSTEVPPILNDFVRRDILRERGNVYSFILPLFEDWLVQKGVGKLIVDTLGDEMAEALRALDDEAYVTATEIAAAISNWPPYMGKERTVGDVQGWLDQRPSLRERRLLFKLVENLRFVREEEVRDKLRIAHSISKQHMGASIPDNRSQRRFDIAITYIDGPGKSGARFAEKYAEVNLISTTSILERTGISESMLAIEKRRNQAFSGIVIIDDIAATGETLAGHLETFLTQNREMLLSKQIPVVVIALFATEDADQRIRETMARHSGIDVDFRVCELITRRLMAFDDQSTMWADAEERSRGKALALEIGTVVCKQSPLGHGGLGLLIAFTDTVPNNTLPVIHASSKNWNALLPRPKN